MQQIMGLSKKTVYDKLVAKVNNIAANEFVLKTKYDVEVPILEKEINNTGKNT